MPPVLPAGTANLRSRATGDVHRTLRGKTLDLATDALNFFVDLVFVVAPKPLSPSIDTASGILNGPSTLSELQSFNAGQMPSRSQTR